MSNKINRGSLPILSAIIALTGCVNLSHIQEFSENSLDGIKKSDEINYSFARHCEDRCLFAAIDSFKILRKLNCPCDIYKRADSVVKVLSKTVSAYFDGLSKLAKNGRTVYTVDPLRKALKDDDLKLLGLKKEDVDAYSQLTDILLRAFTDSFRQKRIKEYIRLANPSLQLILSKLEFIESRNLDGLLDFKKERLFNQYQTLLRRQGLSDYEKQSAATDYYEALAATQNLQEQVSLYSRSLKLVAAGHQKIVENLAKISDPALERNLAAYAIEIRELFSDFNKIKPE